MMTFPDADGDADADDGEYYDGGDDEDVEGDEGEVGGTSGAARAQMLAHLDSLLEVPEHLVVHPTGDAVEDGQFDDA